MIHKFIVEDTTKTVGVVKEISKDSIVSSPWILCPDGILPEIGKVFDGKVFVDFVPEKPSAETILNSVRTQRNELLQQTDWTQLTDNPLRDNADILAYRQALRDITKQPDLENIVWPKNPL